MPDIPFVDLRAGYTALQSELDAAIRRVLQSGWYILGEEVAAFEREFAAFVGCPHCVGVASGTDALLLALRAFDIGAGDEVLTVSHTAVATVAAVELAGATPRFVEVDPLRYTVDPAALRAELTAQTRAIIVVHLYGQPAEMEPILELATERKLIVIEDCAQAHGARYQGRPVGSMGDAAAFSFYPTKNLGAIGDGGAIVTGSAAVAERLQALRQYGWRERYVSDTSGYNSRLDELQAAILRVRLRHLPEMNSSRRRLAALYRERLEGLPLTFPHPARGAEHVYHLLVVQAPERDALRQHLHRKGVATAIHYPVPVHLQPASQPYRYVRGTLPVTEALAARILSLPLYPEMPAEHVEVVAGAIREFYG